MAKSNYKNHPNNPANQAFNIRGVNNKTKNKAWWQTGSSNNK